MAKGLSWVESANDPSTDFPLANLPFGIAAAGGRAHAVLALGAAMLDLHRCTEIGLLDALGADLIESCRAETLNPLMALGSGAWASLRERVTFLLALEHATEASRQQVAACLLPRASAEMQLPARIGDYTDFYASIDHARRVGQLMRPNDPLLPNYKHVPIGYHGRASSIVLSGTDVKRPAGQALERGSTKPVFRPSASLDFELEMGAFIGPGNRLGDPIPIDQAHEHLFGLCLLNDWSARDLQAWEYQPLGPFLGKSFATSLSPWIVPMAALEHAHVAMPERPAGDPAPLPYLCPRAGCFSYDLHVEAWIASEEMRHRNLAPMRISHANLAGLYWTLDQMLAHHTSNGCNLRPGDLLGTGTISGPSPGQEGCLLERRDATEPLTLPTGEQRRFLAEGDAVTLRAFVPARDAWPRIGFGECTGTVRG